MIIYNRSSLYNFIISPPSSLHYSSAWHVTSRHLLFLVMSKTVSLSSIYVRVTTHDHCSVWLLPYHRFGCFWYFLSPPSLLCFVANNFRILAKFSAWNSCTSMQRFVCFVSQCCYDREEAVFLSNVFMIWQSLAVICNDNYIQTLTFVTSDLNWFGLLFQIHDVFS